MKILLGLMLSISAFAEVSPTEEMTKRLHVAIAFTGDCCGVLLVKKQEKSGTYIFPAEKTAKDLEPFREWELKDFKYEELDNKITVGYRLPVDLVGDLAPIQAEFSGESKSLGLLHLSSAANGELHCVDAGKEMMCVVDMTPIIKELKHDYTDIANAIKTNHKLEFDTEKRQALAPLVVFNHDVEKDGKKGMLIKVRSLVFVAQGQEVATSVNFFDEAGKAVSEVKEASLQKIEDKPVVLVANEIFVAYEDLGAMVNLKNIRAKVSFTDITDRNSIQTLGQADDMVY